MYICTFGWEYEMYCFWNLQKLSITIPRLVHDNILLRKKSEENHEIKRRFAMATIGFKVKNAIYNSGQMRFQVKYPMKKGFLFVSYLDIKVGKIINWSKVKNTIGLWQSSVLYNKYISTGMLNQNYISLEAYTSLLGMSCIKRKIDASYV